MSKRAEDAAKKAYPKEENRKMWTSAFGVIEIDRNAPERKAYQRGYEQAEKDINKEMMDRMEKYREMQEKALLADHNYGIHIEHAKKALTLTWEDMQLIWQLCDILNSEQPNLCSSKDFFTEVLNRFNKSKEEK